MSTKRTRLRAVYLTDTERDLVREALEVLARYLDPDQAGEGYAAIRWAKSYTRRRLIDTRALFEDKAAQEPAA